MAFNPSDELLDRLRMVESSGRTDAVSGAGARGPYQIMPATGADFTNKSKSQLDKDKSILHDEEKSRKIASQILNQYNSKFSGEYNSMEKTLASYNAGPGRVSSAIEEGGEDNWKKHLPNETQEYLKKFDTNKFKKGGSISNKIQHIKEKAQSIRNDLNSEDKGEQEAQRKMSELADMTTELIKTDVQNSLKDSVDKLRRKI